MREYGDGARALAGGQTLLVLMKLRFDEPSDIIDLGSIPDMCYIDHDDDEVRIGALATHAAIAESPLGEMIPIIKDCANGIADVQVRNRGTIGGSLASGDPSCDWPALLHTLDAELLCEGPDGQRILPIQGFVEDLYQTALAPNEILTEVRFKRPPINSSGAYAGFKRCAPAYPTATAGVQITLTDNNLCQDVRIALGSAGLTPIHATDAERVLRGKALNAETIEQATEAAVNAAEPVEDMRGSERFKRSVLAVLVKRAIDAATRRCRGEKVEMSHEYY